MVTVNATTDYRGKSTDTKPTDADINALFLEVDTQDFYYFDTDEDWHKVGGSASKAKSVETDLKKSLENLEEIKEDVRDEPMEEKETQLDEWCEISEPEPEPESKSKGK
jgi:ribosome-binding ATPase YchF (GTP1/OBG family)